MKSVPLAAAFVLAAGACAQAQCTPTSNTFCVTIAAATPNHPQAPGPVEAYYINGVEAPELTLTRGQTYTFQMVNTTSFHPFYLTLSSMGAGAPEFTEGVSPVGGVSGFDALVFTVPASAPDLIYYNCMFHHMMGWKLNIVDGALPCYANCDNSTNQPILNVLDFNCFLNKFSAGDTYANCDGSTNQPTLNVLDFNCFLNSFNAGCPR